jgi:hypothetical protein
MMALRAPAPCAGLQKIRTFADYGNDNGEKEYQAPEPE